MDKQMENEMETESLEGCIGIQISQCRWILQTFGPYEGIISILGYTWTLYVLRFWGSVLHLHRGCSKKHDIEVQARSRPYTSCFRNSGA